jgi:hypothetical protein
MSILSLCTIKIQMYFNEIHLASGSAFFYVCENRTFLITNRHNLTGRHQITDQPLDKKTGGTPNNLVFQMPFFQSNANGSDSVILHQRVELRLDCDSQPWLEHPILGASADVVAIDMAKHWPAIPQPIVHANSAAGAEEIIVQVCSKVCVIGYPFGLALENHYPVWVSGTLASEPIFDAGEKPAIYIDCRTNRGSSGSPVFAYALAGGVETEESVRSRGIGEMRYNGRVFMDGLQYFSQPVHRFLGIYSGRINDCADIGLVWREEVIAAICMGTKD